MEAGTPLFDFDQILDSSRDKFVLFCEVMLEVLHMHHFQRAEFNVGESWNRLTMHAFDKENLAEQLESSIV